MTALQLPEPLRTLLWISKGMLFDEIEAVTDRAFTRFTDSSLQCRAALDVYSQERGFKRRPDTDKNDWYTFLIKMAVQDETSVSQRAALEAHTKMVRAHSIYEQAQIIQTARGGLRRMERMASRPPDMELQRKMGLDKRSRPQLP